MGWDGNGNVVRNTGVFTGNTVWQQTRDANREIRADDHDTHDEDLATAIENTVTRDGQNQPTGNLPMGGNRHTNCGEGQALSDYSTLGQNQKSTSHLCTAGGTGNNITLTCDIAPTSYEIGQKFVFISVDNNTGDTFANVNGLGDVRIKKRGGDSLVEGDIVTSEIVIIYYDGASFQLSTLSNQGLGKTDTQTITQVSDGPGVGPILILLRESATPASGDQIGDHALRGRTSTGTAVNYARIRGVINSATAGSTEGRIDFITHQAGAETLAMTIAKGVQVGVPTGGEKGRGAINAQEVYANGDRVYPLVTGLGTPVATTSGTQFDFTGIRSDARRITVMFEGVSLTGGDGVLVQIGPSGGIETTGYNSTASRLNAGGIGIATSTAGFILEATLNAASIRSGRMVLTLIDSSTNTWVADGNGKTTNGETFNCGGDKSLAGALNQLRITRTGTNNFNAGKVNILVE